MLSERVVITEQGYSLASLIPLRPDDLSTPFSRRRTLPEFDELLVVPRKAACYVSEDRDRL